MTPLSSELTAGYKIAVRPKTCPVKVSLDVAQLHGAHK